MYAYTRPTRYGSVAEVTDATMSLTRALDIDESRVNVIDSLPEHVIAKSDVITNSGHLRPLDESLMKHAKTWGHSSDVRGDGNFALRTSISITSSHEDQSCRNQRGGTPRSTSSAISVNWPCDRSILRA